MNETKREEKEEKEKEGGKATPVYLNTLRTIIECF